MPAFTIISDSALSSCHTDEKAYFRQSICRLLDHTIVHVGRWLTPVFMQDISLATVWLSGVEEWLN